MVDRPALHRSLMADYAALCRELARMPGDPGLGIHAAMNTLSCGARTRRGEQCKRTDLAANGRCRFHGGASTGPKTKAGRARSIANLRQNRQQSHAGDGVER